MQEFEQNIYEVDDSVVTLRYMDLEKEFDESVNKYKTGFIIDDSINYFEEVYFSDNPAEGLKRLQKKDSIYSYQYGIGLNDDESIIPKMYSCTCGRTYGMDNIGLECPYCGEIVERTKNKRLGWFKLQYEKVPHPMLSFLLVKEKTTKTNKADDGKVRKGEPTLYNLLSRGELDYTWEDILYQERDGKYSGKLFEFAKKYLSKYKDLFTLYDDAKYWFTSAIPVISKNFRFAISKESNFEDIHDIDQHKINQEYIEISYSVHNLNEDNDFLSSITSKKINTIKEIIKAQANIVRIVQDEFLAGKKAVIQDTYSKRSPLSGMLIMLPVNDERHYGIDKCLLSIDFFRSVFEKEVSEVCKTLNIDPKKIKNLIDVDYTLSEEDNRFIKEEVFPRIPHKYLYTNREPSIYPTSALVLEIANLIDALSVKVPQFILPAIAGDFDGDKSSLMTFASAETRLAMYKALGPKRRIINTRLIKWNNKFGPNNNASIQLYLGYSKEGTLKKIK